MAAAKEKEKERSLLTIKTGASSGHITKLKQSILLYYYGQDSLFVERKVRYSALFTNLAERHAGAVSFPLSDVISALLACPLSDITFCLHSGITNLSLYKH
jgi:hypothetical protein